MNADELIRQIKILAENTPVIWAKSPKTDYELCDDAITEIIRLIKEEHDGTNCA